MKHDITFSTVENPTSVSDRAINEVLLLKSEMETWLGREIVIIDGTKLQNNPHGVLKDSLPHMTQHKIDALEARIFKHRNEAGFCATLGKLEDLTTFVVINDKDPFTMFHELCHAVILTRTSVDGRAKLINHFLRIPADDPTSQDFIASKETNYKEHMSDGLAVIKMAQCEGDTRGIAKQNLLAATYFARALHKNNPDEILSRIEHDTHESIGSMNVLLSRRDENVSRSIFLDLQESYDALNRENTVIMSDISTVNWQEIEQVLEDGDIKKLTNKQCCLLAAAMAARNGKTQKDIQDCMDAVVGDETPKDAAEKKWCHTYYLLKDHVAKDDPAFQPAVRAYESTMKASQEPVRGTKIATSFPAHTLQ
ncbi:MAG: hypothetical protein FWF24_02260 [Alphaproteobacteria bacterium]|nr:hypothetical protein [Alphaproteobacteria bacterium]